jgi:methylenetetrahydrofolate reductase (NADPH)
MSLRDKLISRSGFVVLAELTGGPGFSFDPIERFLKAYKDNPAAIPAEFDLAAITLPQSPGGVANIEPAGVIAHCQAKGLLDNLDVVPHVTCKDMNADAIVSSLMSLRKANVESVLALTGDKPVKAAGVFELESLGLLNAIRKINNDALLQAKPQSLKEVRRFFPGAAVSPFKYTEPSQMQQYYKMEKKIACGAEFLITQVGWDWRKSLELFRYLEERESHLVKREASEQEGPGASRSAAGIPVIGNVYLLSTLTPAPRLMHDGKLPGCFVSDELLAKVQSERVDDHIERAAQQVAMYKTLGAAGVDLGGVPNFELFAKILKRAAEIGTHWEPFKDNLCWPAKEPFYLYNESGERADLITPYPTFGKRFFDFAHWAMLDPEHVGFRAFKKTLSVLGADSDKGAIYKFFNTCEKSFKYLAFDCEECGDCFLPENFGLCTIGGCEKGMDNAPCGDATADGRCGNNLDRVCIGERIYEAAASEQTVGRRPEAGGVELREAVPSGLQPPASSPVAGLSRLRTIINKPRNPALQHTSSIINYLFGKDHTMKNALISIGESIHASIPKTGQIMKELHALGAGAYTTPSPQLDYIRALIESQAGDGADYIAINLDAFGEQDPQQAVNMMVEYVRLVKKWGRGVPVCVDSSSDAVLTAGLKEWYAGLEKGRSGLYSSTKSLGSISLKNGSDEAPGARPGFEGEKSSQEIFPPQSRPDLPFSKPPLLNSIKVYTMDKMMPLKKDYDFSFVGLLVSEEKATGPGGSHSVDELYALAKQLFDAAMRHGFKPEQIFFDSTVFPLAIDMPMEPGVPGYTYRTFETIKKIRSDSRMKGVHCSLGISNCVRDLPARRIGVCRAYVAKAMEYGLDAGIVNTAHQYGSVEAPPELLDLVDAYAKLDGSMEKTGKAMELMAQFCRENRKAS